MRRLLCSLLILSPLACHNTSVEPTDSIEFSGTIELERDVTAELAQWMTGCFSSAAQAQTDAEYFEVRLVMVPIWESRDDGPWLYIEQAVASALDKPYRQRVYHLVEEDGGVRSEVYELPGEALDYADTWRDVGSFSAISPEDLVERTGCAVHLRPTQGGDWAGSTLDDHCLSDFRGATYATSEIVLKRDSIESWDRGFDADGEQVWGAVKGGYVFERTELPK
jgi:CpeT protein